MWKITQSIYGADQYIIYRRCFFFWWRFVCTKDTLEDAKEVIDRGNARPLYFTRSPKET